MEVKSMKIYKTYEELFSKIKNMKTFELYEDLLDCVYNLHITSTYGESLSEFMYYLRVEDELTKKLPDVKNKNCFPVSKYIDYYNHIKHMYYIHHPEEYLLWKMKQ